MARKAAGKRKDLVLAVGSTDDGDGAVVIRSRRQRLEVGEMRPLRDGRPLRGEVVRLEPRPEMPLLFDAETVLTPPSEVGGERSGPAQVASATYRRNWDAIWQKKRSPRELN